MDEMSIDEKKERLKDKLNPFEKENYDKLYESIHKFDGFEMSPDMIDEINKYKEEIFYYEKRIIRGYDLNKYKNNVPKYDSNKFKEDSDEVIDENDIYSLPPMETAQVQSQHEIDLTENQIDAFYDYFDNEYKYINGELSSKYKNNFWMNELTEEYREHYHKKNEIRIPEMDKGINKCSGLIVPTVLYHGPMDSNIVDIHTRVGEHINFNMFISSSFQKDVAMSYGKRLTDGKKLYCKFLANTGTKGICANDKKRKLTSYRYEHEYLLGRKNGGTIVDIDYDTGEITILID